MAGTKDVEREILLSFWKVHILHHAGEEPVVGQWVMRELRRHGYEVSPGTLYPLLTRMEQRGWLRCKVDPGAGPRARKEYTLTAKGRSILALLRHQVEELYREVVLGEEEEPSATKATIGRARSTRRAAPARGGDARERRRGRR
jgi:PadR family transcriptional regulator, regulatory protein PadR